MPAHRCERAEGTKLAVRFAFDTVNAWPPSLKAIGPENIDYASVLLSGQAADVVAILKPMTIKWLGTIPLVAVFGFMAFLREAGGVVPPPDGGYPGFTTAEGTNALQNLTTGVANTAIGWYSLFTNSSGNYNTSIGAGALIFNNGEQNTAVGVAALLSNTTGLGNTATGVAALLSNTTGNDNTATGAGALLSNVGAQNTANGSQALLNNTTDSENTANGYQALFAATTGADNTAVGRQALLSNTAGSENTAAGRDALALNTTGSNNIALGVGAGLNLTTGNNNIDIGNAGGGGEANTIRIGNSQTGAFIAGITGVPVTGTAVAVNIFGQLGVAPSSRRYKDDIKPMDKASEAILALKPVTFRYKKEIDPERLSQFGLVAEEVAKVDPDLVVHDKQGRAYSVRYDQVNAMLLNEFLKAHRNLEEQDRENSKQATTIAQLKTEIASLAAPVKDQATRIETVTAEVQTRKAVP